MFVRIADVEYIGNIHPDHAGISRYQVGMTVAAPIHKKSWYCSFRLACRPNNCGCQYYHNRWQGRDLVSKGELITRRSEIVDGIAGAVFIVGLQTGLYRE